MNSLHRSPSEGRPLFSEQMKWCTWALAKVAEYPTLQHSDITSDPLLVNPPVQLFETYMMSM